MKRERHFWIDENGNRWSTRFYSEQKAEAASVFSNGATSWSQEGKSVFKYIKPAEEE